MDYDLTGILISQAAMLGRCRKELSAGTINIDSACSSHISLSPPTRMPSHMFCLPTHATKLGPTQKGARFLPKSLAFCNKRQGQGPYTIVGFWPDTNQRFSDVVSAPNAEMAEEVCLKNHPGVAICGTILGSHRCVDLSIQISLE